MKFSEVLNNLKAGIFNRYTRTSWETNNYIVLMTEQCITECFMQENSRQRLGVPDHRSFRIEPFLLIKTRDYSFRPYMPTWEDFSAQDWEEV